MNSYGFRSLVFYGAIWGVFVPRSILPEPTGISDSTIDLGS